MKSSTTVTKLSLKLSYLAAAIFVLLPFHAFFTTWGGSNTGFIDIWRIWKEILIILILLPPVSWLIWQQPVLRKWILDSWLIRLIGVYAVLQLAMGAWAVTVAKVNTEALVYGLGINLRFLLFFLICAVVASGSGFLVSHWRKILLLPAAVVLLFGIMQKFALPYDFLRHFGYGDNTIPAYQTVDNDLEHRRIQSLLRGANPLGAYLILIIPALLLCLKKRKVLRWLGLGSALLVLFFSYSRSAWLGVMIAGLVLAVLMVKRTRNLRWLFALAGLTLVFMVSFAYSLRDNDTAQNVLFHSSENSRSAQSSNAARLQALENGVKDIASEPLGRGPGTAGPASLRNNNPARIAENYFLQVGQETGIIGMGLFIAINALVALKLWQRRREQLALILFVSLIGISFVNLISHAWADDTLAYIWWGLAGVALAPTITSAARQPASRQSRLRR